MLFRELEHDRASQDKHVACPLLALWGSEGFVGQMYDVPAVWRRRANDVSGHGLPCGHFLVEECPQETLAALPSFF